MVCQSTYCTHIYQLLKTDFLIDVITQQSPPQLPANNFFVVPSIVGAGLTTGNIGKSMLWGHGRLGLTPDLRQNYTKQETSKSP